MSSRPGGLCCCKNCPAKAEMYLGDDAPAYCRPCWSAKCDVMRDCQVEHTTKKMPVCCCTGCQEPALIIGEKYTYCSLCYKVKCVPGQAFCRRAYENKMYVGFCYCTTCSLEPKGCPPTSPDAKLKDTRRYCSECLEALCFTHATCQRTGSWVPMETYKYKEFCYCVSCSNKPEVKIRAKYADRKYCFACFEAHCDTQKTCQRKPGGQTFYESEEVSYPAMKPGETVAALLAVKEK